MKDAKDKEGRSVKILGRAGILYEDKSGQYYINSEMLVGPEFDLVIYSDDVSVHNNNSDLVTEKKKKEIIFHTLSLLTAKGIKVDVM